LLTWTADYLKKHGASTPRLDAELLLAKVLGCTRIELYTTFDAVPDKQQRAAFRELVRRRAAGTPVAYLLGRREFFSLSFHVTPDVLIPRPETELLVVRLLELAKDWAIERELNIADVGTGCGIIAVCAAKHLPQARVIAIDISPAALAVARQNVLQHGVADRVELVQSDLFAAVPEHRRFAFILSNPPYVRSGEVAELAPEVRNHEPPTALFAGERGTEVIESLIPQAAQRLLPGGYLLIEVSPTIHEAARALVAAEPRLALAPSLKDLARLPRVVQARRR
jgi:release factor glutamine methyltransferase